MRPSILFLLLSAACADKPQQSSSPDSSDPESGEATEVREVCDGLDNNGDGLIDEGFADTDSDGIADCLDEECDLVVAEGGRVSIDSSCVFLAAPKKDVTPLDAVVEWQWSGLSSDSSVCNVTHAPLVGNLNDDDGDGLVNEMDIPDVVFSAHSRGDDGEFRFVVVAVDGASHDEIFHHEPTVWVGTGPALADLDGDGAFEVILYTLPESGFVLDSTGNLELVVLALDSDGTTMWETSITQNANNYSTYISTGDFDGDRLPEVFINAVVLDGMTGKVELTIPDPPMRYMPYAVDLDVDGLSEILMGSILYNSKGATVWGSYSDLGYIHTGHAVFNADDDPEGEVLILESSQYTIRNHDGSILERVGRGASSYPGPPCITDFDGDGEPEIVLEESGVVSMYEVDGTRRWTFNVESYDQATGCSGHDFDGDGISEVVYADLNTLYILDGLTGEVRYRNDNHASPTVNDYPTIADVDNDGSAEIVLASSAHHLGLGDVEDKWCGITVLGNANNGWTPAGTVWNVFDFAPGRVNPDGSIPSDAGSSWLSQNAFRAWPTQLPLVPDLVGEVIDTCWSGCEPDSPVLVSVQVKNIGAMDVEEDISVSIYSLDGVLLETQSVSALAGGTSSDSLLFSLRASDVMTGMRVAVDDDGTGADRVDECNEYNLIEIKHESPCGE